MTEAAGDTGWYRDRCPIPMRAAASRWNATIGDRLVMTEGAAQLGWDRRKRVDLGSLRSWMRTVDLAVVVDPRPVGKRLWTTADSGTGAGPLRTYLR